MEYLGTIYKGSQSDIIFPVPFIELSDGATVDFYTDGDGGFSRTKDEIKIDNYMLRTTASADELNSLNDGVLNYTINTCMGKSEGDTGLYLSEPTSYVNKQYLTADGVKTINGESIVGQGNIEIQGGGSEDYIWEWTNLRTGDTTFTNEQITEIENAYNDGKNIILSLNEGKIYPNSFSLSKDGNDVFISMFFLENGNNCYLWEYYNYVNSNISGQRLRLSSFIKEGNNANIKCRTITTQGHGNLDTAITNLQKQIQSGSSENLQNQIDELNQYIRGVSDERKKGDDELQQQINSVDGNLQHQIDNINESIPRKTSQLTNDSGYLTEHQSLEEYYTKAESDTNYASKSDTYTKGESDGKYALISNTYTKVQSNLKYALIDNTYTKSETYSKGESDGKYASKSDTYTKTEVDDKIKNISGGTSDDSNFKKLRIDISGKTLEQDFMPLFNYLDGIPNSPDMLGCINLILDGKLYIPTRIETEVSSKGYFILIYATGTIDAKRVQLSKNSADSEYTDVYIQSYHLYSDVGNGSSIFIPTTSGNAGQILKSNGVKQIPTWVDFSEYSYTKEEIDSKIGDINNILESI